MAQQTAVASLREHLDAEMKMGTKMVVNWDMYLQMEKEQIIHAWREADNDSMYSPKELDYQAEQYYNETYNK